MSRKLKINKIARLQCKKELVKFNYNCISAFSEKINFPPVSFPKFSKFIPI